MRKGEKLASGNNSLMHRLCTEELGYCCVKSFLKESKRFSGRKVAAALGVNCSAVYYWRNKLASGEIPNCDHCRLPQKPLELRLTASGRAYFARSQLR